MWRFGGCLVDLFDYVFRINRRVFFDNSLLFSHAPESEDDQRRRILADDGVYRSVTLKGADGADTRVPTPRKERMQRFGPPYDVWRVRYVVQDDKYLVQPFQPPLLGELRHGVLAVDNSP